MTISERIFELIRERGYTQKEFSKKTGIAESTISDWKKKGTNPVSDKILIICEVLEVSPYYLLSGIENNDKRSREGKVPTVKPAAKAPAASKGIDAAAERRPAEAVKAEDKKPAEEKPEVKPEKPALPDTAPVARDDDDIKIGQADAGDKKPEKDKKDKKKKKDKEKDKDKDKKKKKDKDKKKKKGYLITY